MEEYLNILAFLVGISTTFFTIFSLWGLFYQKERTRFQLVLGSIMAICAISCLKDHTRSLLVRTSSKNR